MKIGVTAVGASVLVHSPAERVAETVHSLIDQGAVVTVATDDPSPAVRDLAVRGLATLVPATFDATSYAVVLQDPLRPTPQECRDRLLQRTATSPGNPGRVTLVGAGPGHPGLLTVAGLEAVRVADVLVCDRLVPLGVLDQARADARVIHVGKIPRGDFTPQERINSLLVESACSGAHVVRLKGGDGFVFGRGGEEWEACVRAGIPVEVIPGVSSSIAVPGLAGIPLTHRSLSQGFVVVSGHVPPGDPRGTVDWAALATTDLTLVVLMGVDTLPGITAALLAEGMPADTPAACIADGGLPSMRIVRAPVSTLAAAAADIRPPAVTVVGHVVTVLEEPT